MPKTLLLADDSITIQKVVGITFAGEDFNITAVDNGEDALARAREMKPDVILADVVMPRKNGYEVCEAIKSDAALKHIPVLLLAGTFEAFDEARARAARADSHIAKPFDSQALINKVKELVGGAASPSPLPSKTGTTPSAPSWMPPPLTGADSAAAAGKPGVATAPPTPRGVTATGANPPTQARSSSSAVDLPRPQHVRGTVPVPPRLRPSVPPAPRPLPPVRVARPMLSPSTVPPPVIARPLHPSLTGGGAEKKPTIAAPFSGSEAARSARPDPLISGTAQEPGDNTAPQTNAASAGARPQAIGLDEMVRESLGLELDWSGLDTTRGAEASGQTPPAPGQTPPAPSVPAPSVPNKGDFPLPANLAERVSTVFGVSRGVAAGTSKHASGSVPAQRQELELLPFGEPVDLVELQGAELERRSTPGFQEAAGRGGANPERGHPEARPGGLQAGVSESASTTPSAIVDVHGSSSGTGSTGVDDAPADVQDAMLQIGAQVRTTSDGGEAQLREALSQASREVIERIAWEIIPELAETIIREHVEQLMKDRQQ